MRINVKISEGWSLFQRAFSFMRSCSIVERNGYPGNEKKPKPLLYVQEQHKSLHRLPVFARLGLSVRISI